MRIQIWKNFKSSIRKGFSNLHITYLILLVFYIEAKYKYFQVTAYFEYKVMVSSLLMSKRTTLALNIVHYVYNTSEVEDFIRRIFAFANFCWMAEGLDVIVNQFP